MGSECDFADSRSSPTYDFSADAVAIESATSSPGNQAIWTLPVVTPDKYDVFARWGSNDSAASNARYAVTHAGGTDTVAMNQNANAGEWNKLGTYDLAPGVGHKVVLSDRADSTVNADAIQLVSAEGVERVARWEGTVASAGTYQIWARWPAAPSLCICNLAPRSRMSNVCGR